MNFLRLANMEITTIEDINDICRVCLAPVIRSEVSSLFYLENNITQLWTKIMACAWVQISKGDGLPGLICNQCNHNLDIAYNFKQQCESADNHLRQVIGLPTSAVCSGQEYLKKDEVQSRGGTDNHQSNMKVNKMDPFISKNTTTCGTQYEEDYNSSSKTENEDSELLSKRRELKKTTRKYKIKIKNQHIGINTQDTDEIYKEKMNDAHNKKNRDTTVTQRKIKSKAPTADQCELCGKLFHYRGYMAQHMRSHNGHKPHQCHVCQKHFSIYSSLVVHMRTHSGDKPFICQICGKGFSQSAGLTTHMRSHTGERPFKCEICRKGFTQSSNLLIHRQIHSDKRDHVCPTCQKAFKFLKHLKSHMKLHTGIKEYTCNICNEDFHRKSYLNTHMAIHSGLRPHKCATCGHAFSNSSNLTAHMRIHTGVKPFICQVCKKAFAQSSALTRHVVLQHSEVPRDIARGTPQYPRVGITDVILNPP